MGCVFRYTGPGEEKSDEARFSNHEVREVKSLSRNSQNALQALHSLNTGIITKTFQ